MASVVTVHPNLGEAVSARPREVQILLVASSASLLHTTQDCLVDIDTLVSGGGMYLKPEVEIKNYTL